MLARLLGPVEFHTDEGPIRLGGEKERTVLAVLALGRGRPVSVDRLLSCLWDDPPRTALKTLQTYVARLRAAGVPLQRDPFGYLLSPRASLDIAEVEALVTEARRLAADGRRDEAVERYTDALGRWSAPVLAGVAETAAMSVERAGLDEWRRMLEEDRLDALLAAGRHAELIGALERMVADEPLRERRWAQLMVALYRSGRQADALRSYGRLRLLLAEGLGIDPSPELADLEQRILSHDPSLTLVPAAGETGASPSPAGVGSLPGPGNLPCLDPLVGRERDVDQVGALVRAHRLVTVTGPGGVGKSRLAVAVAHEVASSCADGCWLVELAPVRDPSTLAAVVSGVVPVAALPSSTAELVNQIGHRSMLIVLDNCEHLVEAVAELVAALLAGCAELRVLCTSQEALALSREHVWPLPSLSQDAATALFAERARAVRPDMVEDPASVAEIVRRLDRLPLAIELAAGRMTTMTTAEIASQLDDRLALLDRGLRGGRSTHQSLVAVVDWSYDRLAPPARDVLHRLGTFPGSFSPEAAAAVAGGPGGDRHAVLSQLDALVRRSLVTADVTRGGTRYRLLETLRLYALDKLRQTGEADLVARRHAEWCIEWAAGLDGIGSPDERRWLALAVAEFDNLRAAVAFAVDHRHTALAVRLVARLWRLHVLWRAELLDWASQVLALPGADREPDACYVHLLVASLAWITGDLDTSDRAADAALRGDLDEDAMMLASIVKASTLGYAGRFSESAAVLAQLRPVSLPNQVYLRSFHVGSEAYRGRPSGVDPGRVLSDADTTDIPGLRSFARAMVALAWTSQGRSTEASRLLREALELAPPEDRRSVNITREVAALATPDDNGPDDLATRASQALQLARDYPLGIGFTLIGLTLAAERRGRHDVAARMAGYLASHLAELALPLASAENMAGGALERFDTPSTHTDYQHGLAMTSAELNVDLERLAASSPDAGRDPTVHE